MNLDYNYPPGYIIMSNNNGTNLDQLCHSRLKISLKAIERDSSVPECIKIGMKQILECLHQNSLHLELVEAQLSKKASSAELSYSLSQKLSAIQFLEYFNKVQKIMESMERNQKKEEDKMERKAWEDAQRIQKIEELVEGFNRQWDRKKKSSELELETVREEIKQLKKKIDKVKNSELQKQNQNMNIKKQQKSQWVTQFTELSKCCVEMKQNIDYLVQNFEQKTRKLQLSNTSLLSGHKFITFDELRQVLAQLESNLSQSLSNYLQSVIGPEQQYSKKSGQELRENGLESMLSSQFSRSSLFNNDVLLTPTFNPNYHSSKSTALPQKGNLSTIHVEWVSFCERAPGKSKCNGSRYSTRFLKSSQDTDQIQLSQKPWHHSNISTQPHSLNSTALLSAPSAKPFHLSQQSLSITKEGFYQIRCGFQPLFPASIRIMANGELVASHCFTEVQKGGVSRAIMMYLRVEAPGVEVVVDCLPVQGVGQLTGQVLGFLCVEKLT